MLPLLLAAAVALSAAGSQIATPDDLALVNSRRATQGSGPLSLEQLQKLLDDAGVAVPNPAAARFEAARLKEAGFAPLASVSGEQVMRLTLRDPYSLLRLPGVTLVKTVDSRTMVRISSDRLVTPLEAPVSAETWTRFAGGLGSATAPIVFTPIKFDPANPPPICHGWSVSIEANLDGPVSKGASSCSGAAAQAALNYARDLAALAADSFETCRDAPVTSSDAFFRLSACYGRLDPHTTDNP